MYIQKIINNNQSDISNLFSRKDSNGVSYDTYFNCLSYDAINKYLSGNKCTISFKYKGKAAFNIIAKDKKHKKILCSKDLSSSSFNSYISETIDLSTLPKGGILYPSFTNIDNGFEVNDIEYQIDTEENKVEIIIIICTYKREDYVLRNIERLKECKSFIKRVLVIDNGNTLSNKINSDDYINIIPNKNLGGSGGFTRGVLEAKKIGCTHIFLMDDDISFLTETFYRSYNFIKSLNDNHKKDWLGYSMLINDKPTIQYEMGSNWNGTKMWINNHNIDLSLDRSLFKNINHQKYNYSAWWSLIMPVSVIDDYGLPLSFFIKFDDIEYALRRSKEEIIFNNGFGIWHENFKKKLVPINEYYLMRNALITNSLHFKSSLSKNLIRYSGKYFKSLVRLNLDNLEMINKGVKDYLKGPDYFFNIHADTYHDELNKHINNKRHNIFSFFKYLFIMPIFVINIIYNHKRVKKEYIETKH